MVDFGRTVRDNPIPIALIGAGVGWLLMSGWRGNGGGEDVDHEQQNTGANDNGRMRRAARDKVDRMGRKAHSAYDSARRAAGETWSSAQDRASHLGHDVRERARDLGHVATDRAHQARRSFGGMVEEQPLLLGATGLVIGAALGAALPRTNYENEAIGEVRDDLKRGAEEFGREQWDKGKRVVERTFDAAREEAERQGLTPDALRETASAMAGRAGKVAQSAAETAREESGFSENSGNSATDETPKT